MRMPDDSEVHSSSAAPKAIKRLPSRASRAKRLRVQGLPQVDQRPSLQHPVSRPVVLVVRREGVQRLAQQAELRRVRDSHAPRPTISAARDNKTRIATINRNIRANSRGEQPIPDKRHRLHHSINARRKTPVEHATTIGNVATTFTVDGTHRITSTWARLATVCSTACS